MVRDTLRVVAGRRRDDAAAAGGPGEAREEGAGTAFFERTCELQVLELQPDLGAGELRQRARAGERGAHDRVADRGGGRPDVGGRHGGRHASIFVRRELPTLDNDRYHGRMAAAPLVSSRDRLLAAAVEVFVEQGYEGARLQDIARAAGLTTGAVYANFRGKSELLFDAIGQRADREISQMLTEAQQREVRELLELLGDQLVRPRDDVPLLIDAIAAARRDDDLAGALRDRLGARERVLAELVTRAKLDGSIDGTLDTATFARFCLTLAMGALVLRTLQATPPDGDAWHVLISRLLDAVSHDPQEKP